MLDFALTVTVTVTLALTPLHPQPSLCELPQLWMGQEHRLHPAPRAPPAAPPLEEALAGCGRQQAVPEVLLPVDRAFQGHQQHV